MLLAALALAMALPAAALAQPLLDDGDAAELAQELADATEEQDVCYGWSVNVDDDSGASGTDSGSNLGPGSTTLNQSDCKKGYVILRGSISFTCDSCESEDSSSFSVETNIRNGPTRQDLEDLDFSGGQLKGDNGDAALASMVGALPLIVASKGLAPAITADPAETNQPVPAADHATGSPVMPDWLRESWLPLAACVILLGGGAIWLMSSIAGGRTRTRMAARARRWQQEQATKRPQAAPAVGSPPGEPPPAPPVAPPPPPPQPEPPPPPQPEPPQEP
jgi:hypothetical protein